MGPPIATKLTSDFVWQRFEIKKNEKDPSDLSKVICTLCKTVMSRGPSHHLTLKRSDECHRYFPPFLQCRHHEKVFCAIIIKF